MVVEAKQIVIENVWSGLYGESWKGLICDEAFAHPAKFSRALIRKIYDHVIEEGWATKGSSVVDPFGGVALGAFDAMRHGLNWYGCELEEKFVGLGGQNIALWNDRFSRMPNWGTARLVEGDSRKLSKVLSAAKCCVSSPPYAASLQGDGAERIDLSKTKRDGDVRHQRLGAINSGLAYGDSMGQLGAMKEGDHSLVVSSPPYVAIPCRSYPSATGSREHGRMTEAWNTHQKTAVDGTGYGTTEGQLGAMPEGQLCITSPPYNPPMSQDHNGTRGGSRGTTPSEKGAFVKYGNTDGQLEGMSMDGFDAAISSPPFPQPYTGGGGINVKGYRNDKLRPGSEDQPFDLVGQRTYQSKGGDRAESNLETLDATGFEAAISSPPFESSTQVNNTPGDITAGPPRWEGGNDSAARVKQDYADYSPDNMGNQRGETFWSASRLILEQLHQVIVPGGHAIFVVKAFVRDKQIVDFPAQWAQLCEVVGFRLLHHHRASLVEKGARQPAMDQFDIQGDTWRMVTRDRDYTVARKSFFRRLAEKKGSPRIDHESVLCFERP